MGEITTDYDAIVIGSGPAGLMAAGEIGKGNKRVLLLEKNKVLGKKLLISGSGQCNFTHDGDIKDFETRYGDNVKFLKKAFQVFDNQDAKRFFEAYGIALTIRENKKVFPKTQKSETIRDALVAHCKKYGVTIRCEQEVVSISKALDGYTVHLTDGTTYTSQYVIVATGGNTYPITGSTGAGYAFAEQLGHRIITPKPALTYVTTHEKQFVPLSGIAFPHASMRAWREDKLLFERQGSLLFTHKGVSGPLVLDSTRWLRAGDKLEVNFMYPQTYQEVRDAFAQAIANRGKEHILTYLTKTCGLIKSFATVVCQESGISEQLTCAQVTKVQREALVNTLTRTSLSISGLGGNHVAMVTAGGVHLKEVNPTTMESRKHKGLYFIGEVLDIDGDTGGYNIQAAFSMAHVCAQHITK